MNAYDETLLDLLLVSAMGGEDWREEKAYYLAFRMLGEASGAEDRDLFVEVLRRRFAADYRDEIAPPL